MAPLSAIYLGGHNKCLMTFLGEATIFLRGPLNVIGERSPYGTMRKIRLKTTSYYGRIRQAVRVITFKIFTNYI